MRLTELRLNNFRVFSGKQALTFTVDGARNATLIFGANGSGKSTLLNAFTWALYNRFTPSFEHPEKLLSDRAIHEAPEGAELEVSVEVEFEHDGAHYKARRSQLERKTGAKKTVITQKAALTLSVRDASGRSVDRGNAQESIEQILPLDLYNFFFFDGERIEKLVAAQGRGDIAKAIKSLLDLEILERSVRHLNEAQKHFEAEIGSAGDGAGSALKQALFKARTDFEDLANDEELRSANIEGYRAEISAIEDRLRSLAEVKTLQAQRDDKKGRVITAEATIADATREIRKELNGNGFTAFLKPAIGRTLAIAEEKRAKGKLPHGISEQFITDRIQQGRCICGTAIHEGSAEHVRLLEVAKDSGQPDVDNALISLAAICKAYLHDADALEGAFDERFRRIDEARASLMRLNEELSEISEKLKSSGSEDVVTLESRRSDLTKLLGNEQEAFGGIRVRSRDLLKTISEHEQSLLEIEAKDKKSQLARDRMATAKSVRECLQDVLTLRTHQVRSRLNANVRAVFRSISYKDYSPLIEDDFSLRLVKGDGAQVDPVAKSTGEAQLLSLSFVGTVAQEAYREQQAPGASSPVAPQRSFYPVVMDSPFGNLDVDYQAEIAAVLPQLAPQVIVLFSRSQSSNVQAPLRPNTSSCWVINFHTDRKDAKDATFDVFGHAVPIITTNPHDPEWAELIKVVDFTAP